MKTSLTRTGIVLALALSGASTPLLAQNGGPVRPFAQSERVVPNVPDRHGCVAMCEFDLNPCDPPLYKKLDGRCTWKN